MKTITFSAIKGGVGKSSLAILTANILAASGYRVLCIDADPQNSMTFYYLPDSNNISESLANVLQGDNINTNIKNSEIPNIDILPSSLDLFNCRAVDYDVLLKALSNINESYEYLIIDTAPTLDNVTFNCLTAADKIITPVQFSNFDYKSTLFYKNIISNMKMDDKWYLAMNKFKNIKTGNSIAGQFFQIYSATFTNICQNRIPDSSLIKQYFDTAAKITSSKSKLNICNSLKNFVSEISENKITAEAF